MKNLFDLTGKNAIVIGGTRGIGRAIAQGFHDQGARVVIVGTNERVHQAASEIASGGGAGCWGVVCDVGQRQQREGMFQSCMQILNGKLDILVNNAAVREDPDPLEFTYELYDRMMAVNLESVFFISQMAAKAMIPNGGGRIINITSLGGMRGSSENPVYSAAKGGVRLMTESLSNLWAPKGVLVNAIAPGLTNTDLTAASGNMNNPHYMTRLPVGRVSEPEDMVGAALLLASDAGRQITGTTIMVDGGALAK